MAYIGVSPSNGVRRVYTYTATANQTSFSGVGAENITLSYKDANYVDVYQNGVKLASGDYTATSGTAIVLGTGATVNDMVVIVVFDAFSAADTVSKADGGQFDGNVVMAGTLAVTGTTALTGNATMAGTLGVTGVLTGTSLDISGDIDVDGTTNLDVVDIDGAVDMATTLTLAGNADFNGDLDVDGTTNLDVVDIDGAVDMASTLTVGGVTTLNGKFLIDGSNNDLMTFRTTGDTASQVLGLQFQNNSEAVTAQMFGTGDNSSSGVFRIKGIGNVDIVTADVGVNGNPGQLSVKHGGDVHVGTGDLIFATAGKGIVLGATSNTDANTLEDYEEGTWSPVIGGDATYSNQQGHYTKIGRLVFIRGDININALGTGSTNTLQGLPFSGNFQGTPQGGVNVMYYSNLSQSFTWMGGYVLNNSPGIYFVGNTSSAVTIGLNGVSVFQNNARILFSAVYIAN